MHFLALHLVFREIFDIDFAEVAESAVEGDVGDFYAFELHALHEVLGEVEPGGGCRDGSFVLSEDTLEVLEVLWFCGTGNHVAWQGCFAEGVERLFEFLVGAVVEEAECAAAAGSVVDDFSHH